MVSPRSGFDAEILKTYLLGQQEPKASLESDPMSRVLVVRREASRVCRLRGFPIDEFLEGVDAAPGFGVWVIVKMHDAESFGQWRVVLNGLI